MNPVAARLPSVSSEEAYPKKELEDLKIILEVALWVVLYLGDFGQFDTTQFCIGALLLLGAKWLTQKALDSQHEGEASTVKKVEKLFYDLEFLLGTILVGLTATHVINPALFVWIFFGSQIVFPCINQVVKRLSGEERYRCGENNRKKYFEDAKFFTEYLGIWLFLCLGDLHVINTTTMGVGVIATLSLRLFFDYKIHGASVDLGQTISKTVKYLALFEFAVGVTLSALLLAGPISPDTDLWVFFGAQLCAYLASQIAKRIAGEQEERYACCKTPV